jgi:hypothetical protein
MKVTKPNQKIITAIRIVFGLCCLLAAGTAFAQKVAVDFDKDTDFSKYRTYRFAPVPPAPVPLVNQLIEEGVRNMFEKFPPREKM